VQRRRRNNVASVATQINARCEPSLVADKRTRVREIEVATATTRATFHRRGQTIVLPLETFQARLAAVPGINIEHDEARDRTGDDSNPGLWPIGNPSVHLFHLRAPVLKFLPAHQRTLAAPLLIGMTDQPCAV